MLKEYGPWALVALLGFAVRFLYNEVTAANARTIAMAERILPMVAALLPLVDSLKRERERR